MNVSHGGVDDGAVRHSLRALGLCGSHHLFLRGLLIEDVSVRVCTLRILWFPLGELKLTGKQQKKRLIYKGEQKIIYSCKVMSH